LSAQQALSDTTKGPGVHIAHTPGDAGAAARILRDVAEFPPLPGLEGRFPTFVQVALAPDEATFRAEAGGAVPEWGAAVALPRDRKVIIPTFPSARTRGTSPEGQRAVLRHEWAHIALTEALQGQRPPRWFDEGYAEWSSAGWDASAAWRLRLAIAMRRAPALDSLSLRWPRDRASAEVAYLLSATAVEYLARSSGERGLTALIANWNEEGDFERALRRTYGVTLGQLEEDWRAHVKRRYGWTLFASQSLVIWGLLAVALLFVRRARARRTREHLARLRASEPPSSPDFWTHPPGANPNAATGYALPSPTPPPPVDGAT